MLKPDEIVRLDNFKAQYHSILGNIQIATSELNILIGRKEDAEEEVEVLKAHISSLKDEVSKLEKHCADMQRISDKRLSEALEARSAAIAEEKTSREEIKNLDKQSQTLVNLITVRNKEITVLDEKKSSLLESVQTLIEKMKSLTSDMKSLSITVSSLHKESSMMRESLDILEEAHESRKSRMKEEIADLTRKADTERAKIVEASAFYAKKDAEYARRESDIQVVTRRLKKLFNEIKPGTALKI